MSRGSARVVLSAQGGIGNQLFQWAFARSLEADGLRVEIDSVRCRGDRPFAIAPLVPREHAVPRARGLLLAAAERTSLLPLLGLTPVEEPPGGGYHPHLRDTLGDRSYVRGYFQSEEYFVSIAAQVRSAVRDYLDTLLTSRGRALAQELRADAGTVAVHIRRGDYVSDPSAAVVHGTLGADYYARAIECARDRGARRVVWFSDDLAWVAATLAEDGDLLCPSGLTTADGGEIALIASCRQRVIANSSFSWWGGWLTDDRWPSVLAPARWFSGAPEPRGLVPERWTRV